MKKSLRDHSVLFYIRIWILLMLVVSLLGSNTQGVFAQNLAKEQDSHLLSPTGTITLWHYYNPGSVEENTLLQVISNAELNNPGLNIIPEYHDLGSINTDYATAVKEGNGPDLLITLSDYLGDESRQNVILNLDSYLVGKLTGFTQNSIDAMKVNGSIYGLPVNAKVVALYYNKSLVSIPPTNTTELLSLVQGGKLLSVPRDSVYYLYGYWNAFGGHIMDNTGFCVADQGGVADALQYFHDLQAAGASFSDDYTSANDFMNGNAAMTINGPWQLNTFEDALGTNLGVVMLPAGPAGASIPMSDPDTIVVNPNTSNRVNAVTVALYLTNQASSQMFTNVANFIPVRTDVTSSDPLNNAFVDVFSNGVPRTKIRELKNYWPTFQTAIDNVLGGTQAPAEAVSSACWEMNRVNGFYPTFTAWINSNNVHGYNWPDGDTVTMDIDDPSNGPGTDYSFTDTVHPASYASDWFVVEFNLSGQVSLAPGFIITMSNGMRTKTQTLLDMTVTEVDDIHDTVSGTAPAGTSVNVWVFDSDAGRTVTTGVDGIWVADFAHPGLYLNEQTLYDIVPGTHGQARSSGDEDGDQTGVDWSILIPHIDVWFTEGHINAYDWPLNTELTLDVEASNPPDLNPEYSTSTTVGVASWNPNQTLGEFYLNGAYEILPGMQVTVSGSDMSRQILISEVTVTSVDPVTDIISGTTEPNRSMWMWTPSSTCCRNFQADSNGNWIVDYSEPGPNGEPVEDILPGWSGTVNVPDDDWDNTSLSWFAPNPNIAVRASDEQIEAYEWPVGSEVTFRVDHPGTPANPDYSTTRTMGATSWDPSRGYFNLSLWDIFDIQIGDMVTVTDGITTKTLTVTNLSFTQQNVTTDTVSGVASPNASVNIWACDNDNPCVNRHVTANSSGNWVADFAHAGTQSDEQTILDLVPGVWVDSEEYDTDGDRTMFGRTVPRRISLAPYTGWINARGWPLGTNVTMTIDDPSNGTGVDYTADKITVAGGSDLIAEFSWPSQLTPGGGFLITMSGGGDIQTYVVADQRVTSFDVDADTVSGIATPGANVQVCVNFSDHCAARYVKTDGDGNWTVDYSIAGPRSDEKEIVDLQQGMNGWSAERATDGDETWFDWHVPTPNFSVRAPDNHIEIYDWPLGSTVTISINHPDTPVNPDYSTTQIVGVAPWNPSQTYVNFNLWDSFDIVPGDIVTITDGISTKVLTITNLAFTEQNVSTDTVSGVASPGGSVNIWACDNISTCVNRHITADGSGNWVADFAHPGVQSDEQSTMDLRPGYWVDSEQVDQDGDRTMFGQGIPNPKISVRFPENQVHGYEWPAGASVQLMIDDPDIAGIENYTDTQIADTNGFVAFVPAGFELKSGQSVVMTDGTASKDHTITNLQVTKVDINADTVAGTADPGSLINVGSICDGDYCAFRRVTADGEGDWIADFSVAGEDDDEQNLFDIRPGTGSEASQPDNDWDATTLLWVARDSYIKASAAEDWVHAYGWTSGATLTLEVDDPDNGTGVDFSTITVPAQAPWNPTAPDIIGVFDLTGIYDLQAGDHLTVSAGDDSSVYIVPGSMTQVRWFVGLGGGTDSSQVYAQEEVLDDYNTTHQDVELLLEIVPNGEARNVLQAEIDGGNMPDIVGPVGWAGSNAFAGQWLDLSQLIQDKGFDTSIFNPALVNLYQTEEGQVGLPFAVFPSAIYYNPADFDAAGVNYPPAHYGEKYQMPDGSMVDWSWDTVTQVSKLLTLDSQGRNATNAAFNPGDIVQYGFSFGWSGNPKSWGAYWQSGNLVQGTPGSYTAPVPESWKTAWKWVYTGMWSSKPYIPNGPASDDLGGNVFASGKVAMLENPIWYTCCVGDFVNAGGTFQFGAMPSYNGLVSGRVDADTFRILKSSPHSAEAFDVMAYLVTDGVDKLIPVYGAMPAMTSKQQTYFDTMSARFPFVTQESWNLIAEGLNYPDIPSAEGWMPNFNQAWDRLNIFGNLVSYDSSLNMDDEISSLQADLEYIYNVGGLLPPPTVVSSTRGNTNPSNLSSVKFTVTFSKAVRGVDAADFSLTTSGITGAKITGVSGSGKTRTVTVSTGTGNGSLRLNVADNDSIIDGVNTSLGGEGGGNGNFTTGESYSIDKTAPKVVSSVRVNPSPTSLASVGFTVTFTENVTGVDAADFSLTVSGIAGAKITAVSGSGKTRTVTVSTGSGSGTLRLNVVDNDTILDAAGNKLGGTGAGNGNFTAGQIYTVSDKIVPKVLSSVRVNPSPTNLATVSFTVTFTENVTGVDIADFNITASGITGAVVKSVTGSGATRTVTIGTGTGNGTLRLNVVDNDTILDAAGNKLGGTGTGNGNFTAGQTYTIKKP